MGYWVRLGIHKRGFGRGFWNVGEEFAIGFRDSLEEIFGISERGHRERFLGYVGVISRAFQGGEI